MTFNVPMQLNIAMFTVSAYKSRQTPSPVARRKKKTVWKANWLGKKSSLEEPKTSSTFLSFDDPYEDFADYILYFAIFGVIKPNVMGYKTLK